MYARVYVCIYTCVHMHMHDLDIQPENMMRRGQAAERVSVQNGRAVQTKDCTSISVC